MTSQKSLKLVIVGESQVGKSAYVSACNSLLNLQNEHKKCENNEISHHAESKDNDEKDAQRSKNKDSPISQENGTHKHVYVPTMGVSVSLLTLSPSHSLVEKDTDHSSSSTRPSKESNENIKDGEEDKKFEETPSSPLIHTDKINYNVWDTAGNERFAGLDDGYYIGSDAAIIMFNVEDNQSFLSISSKWIRKVRRICGVDIPIAIVGSKLPDEKTCGKKGKKESSEKDNEGNKNMENSDSDSEDYEDIDDDENEKGTLQNQLGENIDIDKDTIQTYCNKEGLKYFELPIAASLLISSSNFSTNGNFLLDSLLAPLRHLATEKASAENRSISEKAATTSLPNPFVNPFAKTSPSDLKNPFSTPTNPFSKQSSSSSSNSKKNPFTSKK